MSEKPTLREEIFKRIEAERERQIAKFGDQAHRPDGDWALILGEEVGEWMRACLDGDKAHAIEEMIQVLAVGTAWLEGRMKPKMQRYQKVRVTAHWTNEVIGDLFGREGIFMGSPHDEQTHPRRFSGKAMFDDPHLALEGDDVIVSLFGGYNIIIPESDLEPIGGVLEPKHCPECGGLDLTIFKDFSIGCADCPGKTPPHPTPEEAIAWWNALDRSDYSVCSVCGSHGRDVRTGEDAGCYVCDMEKRTHDEAKP